MKIGKQSAARGLLGWFHHRAWPPLLLGMAGDGGGHGGDRLFFTVRDLIARRFHYLCTNVTFSSDQGAQQPLAAWLAGSQTIVQKVLSQSGLARQTKVIRGTAKPLFAKHIKKQRSRQKLKAHTHTHKIQTRIDSWIIKLIIDQTSEEKEF